MKTQHPRGRASAGTLVACGTAAFALVAAPPLLNAADITKNGNNNTVIMASGSAWVGGVAPGAGDVMVFSATTGSSKTGNMGADMSVLGIRSDATTIGTFTINSGNTLTLGASGIDMSVAAQNFTINSALTLGATQSWTINSGRILTIGGTLTEGGNVANVSGAGTLQLNIGSATTFNGLIASTSLVVGTIAIPTGPLTLANTANTFDALTITNGNVSGSTIGNFGVASSFGDGGTNTVIAMGGNGSDGGITYTGVTASSNRTFQHDPRSAVSSIIVSTAGQTLSLSGNLTTGNIANTVAGNGWVLGGAGNLTVSGVISDSANATRTGTTLTKTGTGTLVLSGNNTFTGLADVQSGTLVLGRSGGTIANAAAVQVSGGALDVANSDTVGAVTLSSGLITGTATLTGSSYSLTNTGTVNAILAGSGVNLTKSGTGTATLNAANTYSGTTTISAGTLVLGSGGSFANSPVVNLGTAGSRGTLDVTAKASFAFGAGQSLTGDGTINIGTGKTVTVNGAFAPGNSTGVVDVSGNLSLTSSTATTMELAANTGGAGVAFDNVNVTGSLAYGGALSIVSFGGYSIAQPGTYDLFDFTSQTGNFSSVTVGGLALTFDSGVWSASNGGFNYDFALATGDLVVTAVPEPSTWLLLTGALGVVQIFRRRRD